MGRLRLQIWFRKQPFAHQRDTADGELSNLEASGVSFLRKSGSTDGLGVRFLD